MHCSDPRWPNMTVGSRNLYPLVNVYIANWKITMFNGKTHHEWKFSLAMSQITRGYICFNVVICWHLMKDVIGRCIAFKQRVSVCVCVCVCVGMSRVNMEKCCVSRQRVAWLHKTNLENSMIHVIYILYVYTSRVILHKYMHDYTNQPLKSDTVSIYGMYSPLWSWPINSPGSWAHIQSTSIRDHQSVGAFPWKSDQQTKDWPQHSGYPLVI